MSKRGRPKVAAKQRVVQSADEVFKRYSFVVGVHAESGEGVAVVMPAEVDQEEAQQIMMEGFAQQHPHLDVHGMVFIDHNVLDIIRDVMALEAAQLRAMVKATQHQPN